MPASPESITPVFPYQSHQWLWIPGSPRIRRQPKERGAAEWRTQIFGQQIALLVTASDAGAGARLWGWHRPPGAPRSNISIPPTELALRSPRNARKRPAA